MRRVYVTGLGVVSSLGFGRDEFWRALCEGRDGASEVRTFDTSDLTRHVACEVRGFRPRDHLTVAEAQRTEQCSAYALAAARMAARDAGMAEDALTGEQTSVILGTTMGEAKLLSDLETVWFREGEAALPAAKLPRYGTGLLPLHVARSFGARGLVQTLPAACAAGNYAIAFAADQIRAGRAEVTITGASEVLQKTQFAGFCRLGAMATSQCQPFDRERQGLLLGDGAALMILESEDHLVRRNGTPLAEVGGVGIACDAYHITRPHPEGEGNLHAIRQALEASRIGPRDVQLINAHGTGTQANDPVEARVLAEMFGNRSPPVTSIKSMLGHCMGAASALEAVSCVLSVDAQMAPPTIHYANPDPDCDLDVVANEARRMPADIVLNNSLAFGGYDAVLCFGRPGVFPGKPSGAGDSPTSEIQA